MNEYIDLSGLLPSLLSLWPFPGWNYLNAEHLSAMFVLLMLFISVLFIGWAFYSSLIIKNRIEYLQSLTENAPQINAGGKKNELANHLWTEFSETLIEINSSDANGNKKIIYYNTIDSNHFFNASTLAAELTENRLLAAVPGLLTGLGVLGTFIGLQLGLSELNIGNDVAVDEMKTGLAQVISGAKIAFLTSVWGVLLSLIFNFIEKIFERNARKNIKIIQNKIDNKYPRLTSEYQLQQISDNSAEMRNSLQHLGEKIGDRLQTEITNLGNKIIGPITGLAERTGDENKNVLDSLIKEFLEQFRAVGGDQAAEMKKANERFTVALSSLDSSIALLLKQLEENQGKSVAREQALIERMSNKVDELVEKSNAQHKILADFVGKTLVDIGKGEIDRNESTSQLLQRLESALQNQLDASQQLIKQGEKLQEGINSSIQNSVIASTSMKETASELNQASQHMKGTGFSIENAGKTLAGSISQAAHSTTALTQENKTVMSLLNTQQQKLHEQQQRINETIIQINSLFDKATSSFSTMDIQQREFLKGLENHVNELSTAISKSFNEYAEGLNTATQGQLITWVKSTTDYTSAMTGAINALRNVVDEIDSKLSIGG